MENLVAYYIWHGVIVMQLFFSDRIVMDGKPVSLLEVHNATTKVIFDKQQSISLNSIEEWFKLLKV